MKTLAFAALASALIAAPALAAPPPNAGANAAPASAKTLNPAQHTYKIGDRISPGYATKRYAVADPEKLGLAKPADLDHRWIVVENNAYLINSVNDTVEDLAPVKPAK